MAKKPKGKQKQVDEEREPPRTQAGGIDVMPATVNTSFPDVATAGGGVNTGDNQHPEADAGYPSWGVTGESGGGWDNPLPVPPPALAQHVDQTEKSISDQAAKPRMSVDGQDSYGSYSVNQDSAGSLYRSRNPTPAAVTSPASHPISIAAAANIAANMPTRQSSASEAARKADIAAGRGPPQRQDGWASSQQPVASRGRTAHPPTNQPAAPAIAVAAQRAAAAAGESQRPGVWHQAKHLHHGSRNTQSHVKPVDNHWPQPAAANNWGHGQVPPAAANHWEHGQAQPAAANNWGHGQAQPAAANNWGHGQAQPTTAINWGHGQAQAKNAGGEHHRGSGAGWGQTSESGWGQHQGGKAHENPVKSWQMWGRERGSEPNRETEFHPRDSRMQWDNKSQPAKKQRFQGTQPEKRGFDRGWEPASSDDSEEDYSETEEEWDRGDFGAMDHRNGGQNGWDQGEGGWSRSATAGGKDAGGWGQPGGKTGGGWEQTGGQTGGGWEQPGGQTGGWEQPGGQTGGWEQPGGQTGGGWEQPGGQTGGSRGHTGDGWTQPSGEWGAQTGGWGAASITSHHGQTNESRGAWDADNKRQHKVTFAQPESDGNRNILSPQQRSQILNSLLNAPQGQKAAQHAQAGIQQHLQKLQMQDQGGKQSKDKKKQQKAEAQGHHQSSYSGWGIDDGWGTIPEEDEYDKWREDDRQIRFTPKGTDNHWGGSQMDNYTMPSKTLAHAYKGTTTSLNVGIPRNSLNDYTNVQFVESKGAALEPVRNALFGKSRLARDRIHWMFSPNKDERVASLLTWIQTMSYNLGTFGLHKFLQSRERGALIANAEYRHPDHPKEPAFDWLTFDQLQMTMDKIMQESVAFYDPSVHVIVFVFLPSKTGNSVAMWRRKINVPNNIRLMLQGEINLAMSALRKDKDYVVHVDELPKRKNIPHLRSQKGKAASKIPLVKVKKRKWWHLFF